HLDPNLGALSPRELARNIAREARGQLAPFWTLQRGLMVVAFVAVLSTLLLVGVQRRRELGLLAAIGMQPGELARMVVVEAAVVAAVGSVGGVISGIGMFEALREAVPVLLGFHDPFRLDFTSVLVYGP